MNVNTSQRNLMIAIFRHRLAALSLVMTLAVGSVFALPQPAAVEAKKAYDRIEQLLREQHYASAYALADSLRTVALTEVQRRPAGENPDRQLSRQLLTATWYMERAAVRYQEDVRDSSQARFRTILPYMARTDKVVCYLLLDEVDSALADTVWLRAIPNTHVATFCEKPTDTLFCTTPTLYDLVMQLAIERTPSQERQLLLRRQLVDYYRGLPPTEANINLLLFNERELLSLQLQRSNLSFSEQRRLVEECLDRYRALENPQVAFLYQHVAQLRYADSLYVEALAYADTAIRRFPGSEGAIACANLRMRVLNPTIHISMTRVMPAGRDLLASVTVRNVDTLHYRILAYSNEPNRPRTQEELRAHYLKGKVLHQWSQATGNDTLSNPHHLINLYAYLPSLPAGHYLLLASPSVHFQDSGFCLYAFTTTAAAVVVSTCDTMGCSGYVVDYLTGAPLAGQKVQLQVDRNWNNHYTTLATATTDAQGYFHIQQSTDRNGRWADYRLLLRHKGLDIPVDLDMDYVGIDTLRHPYRVLFDRPVYRPGDTVQFLAIRGQVRHNREGHTPSGDSLRVNLIDVNRRVLDSLVGVTDAYGSLSGRVVIPVDALPGLFHLCSKMGSELLSYDNIKVESYKQPKFTVTLTHQPRTDADGHSVQPHMGDSLWVEGLAATYTGVPVGQAQVVWSVKRDFLRPWWRSYGWVGDHGTALLCSDTLRTDAEGHFRIGFAATPDSTMRLAGKPNFLYTVQVDVTDVAGETHSRTLTLRLGYENTYLQLLTEAGTQLKENGVSTLDRVRFHYCDLNDTPLQGLVQLTVERLRQPDTLRLPHPLVNGFVRHTLSREEFHRRFPHTPYTHTETQMSQWPVESLEYSALVDSKGLASVSVPLPVLKGGVYRITLTCGEAKATQEVIYTPREATRVQSTELLWADISANEVRVGDTLTLRVGSRHKGVVAYYQLRVADRVLDRQMLRLGRGITTLRIPVTGAMLGGMDIHLVSVKEGYAQTEHLRVEVPFRHKELQVEFLTFRDHLAPGDRETWTLRVGRAENGERRVESGERFSAAALLLTLYDAALDAYGSLNYHWWPWLNTPSVTGLTVDFSFPYQYNHQNNLLVYPLQWQSYKGKRPAGWTFSAVNHRSWQFGGPTVLYCVETATARGESGMVKRRTAEFEPQSAKIEISENNAMKCDAYGEDMEISNEIAIFSDLEVEEEEMSAARLSAEADENPYIRTRLGTLAFFEPTLRTDSTGMLEYTFTAPDLLTQWNLKGMAWTQDLSVGTVERQLITRQRMMVQPNIPRFLREGDSATLLAQVQNMTDSNLTATVQFTFGLEAATPWVDTTLQVVVPAGGSAPMAFSVYVPVGGTVATYRIVAQAGRYSDGEQGPLPLLGSRQAVTTSVSMYHNGGGNKQYRLEIPTSPTAQPVGLTVEYTANPLWLAIRSLPYMEQCENPSNLYLLNRYFTLAEGQTIAQQYPELQHCADNVTQDESPLMANAELKQTLLAETPWLVDGTSEVEQLRQLARFYDADALNRQLQETLNRLRKAQRSDGGWSWLPDGHYSSAYVTQYILRGMADLSRHKLHYSSNMESRALAYADKEAYSTYLEWLRYQEKHPEAQCSPIMLDYLYTRSYYPNRPYSGSHKKAHDYFYAQAKERYGEYTSLYNQALLALVFHRGGDDKLAREMLTRIRQKALRSDEMGLYWRDNKAGYFYYQRPIETQALLIEAFREVLPDGSQEDVALMQQWLLKQKQTTHWGTDVATLRAIQALLPTKGVGSGERRAESGELSPFTIHLSPYSGTWTDTLNCPATGSGQLRHTYRADSLQQLVSAEGVALTLSRQAKKERHPSWGALYYQYTEQMDRIPASETGITLRKQLYRVGADGSLTEVREGQTPLRVGDHLLVRLYLSCDRTLEYVQLREHRAACLEPTNTASGWVWDGGLSYYVAVGNSRNDLYVDRLEKGRYIIDGHYYVTNPGTFILAPSVVQCLYAPEFRATSVGGRLHVED